MATQTEEPGSQPVTSVEFSAVMQTITTCQTTLTDKIDHLQSSIGFIRKDLDSFREHVTEVE